MPQINLTEDEARLIEARRNQAAERQAAATHQGLNLLEMSQADYYKLTPEEQSQMRRDNFAAAMRKDNL